MKRLFVFLSAVTIICLSLNAQTRKNDNNLQQKVSDIEDRIALKELVDNFSILADKKDVKTQVLLFTPDAVLETVVNGASAGTMTGRQALEQAFGTFLANFEIVYHFDGQQTVTLNGDKASGISYCMVTLIGTEKDKKMKTTFGIHYKDEFVRQNGKWLIARRTSVFDWQDKQSLGQ